MLIAKMTHVRPRRRCPTWEHAQCVLDERVANHSIDLASFSVAAVAIGWFLPLFGITLVGFLMVDIVIAAIKRRGAS